MPPLIFFDLEGPLSPQDNAYEVMKLIESGDVIFETISKYDDFIAMEGREGYEPGDTLALIVPFLLLHRITGNDIKRVSDRANIVEGAKWLIARLKAENWHIYIISTSYEQHAYNIGRKLGINASNIVCTALDLERQEEGLNKENISMLRSVEKEVIKLYHSDDTSKIVSRLDTFFFEDLPSIGYNVFSTRVIGGDRKVEAMKRIAEEEGKELRDVFVVGDSITDYKMLREVRSDRGISVVFNGNEYAVPYANVGLASLDIRFLYIVCDAFVEGGREKVMEVVSKWEKEREGFEKNPEKISQSYITPEIKNFIIEQKDKGKKALFPFFHNLEGADERDKEFIIKIHKEYRMRMREKAGRLG